MQVFQDEHPEIYLDQVEAIEARLAGRDLSDTILLSGSSIMEQWETSERDLLPLKSVNIGIGGTKVFDHITYFDRLILPHAPQAIVIYAGSNDINGVPGSSKSGMQTAALVIDYLQRIRANFPATPLFYINIMEAPSKEPLFAEIQLANRLICAFCEQKEKLYFVECGPAFLDAQGRPDASLYVEDRLHLKPEGYERWRKGIRPALLAVLS
jgi:lysophospholipase L1-like esterase